MTRHFTILFWLLISVVNPLSAQQILWQDAFSSFPFSGDPETSWSNDPSQSPQPWSWTQNGEANGLFWNDRHPIGSASGPPALVFNSDSLLNIAGEAAPHQGITTSPVIQLPRTGEGLFLSFYQYFRSHRSFGRVELIDLEADEVYEVYNTELIGTNVATSHKERIVVDLTDLPLTGDVFQLRFLFQGSYYFWLIDDVTFYDSYPFPQTLPAYVGDSLAAFGKPYAVNCNRMAIVPRQLVVQFKPGVSEADKQELRDEHGVSAVTGCMCDQLELWQLDNPLPFDPAAPPSATGPSNGIDELKASASSSSKVDGVDQNFYNWNELKPSSESPLSPLPSVPGVGTPGSDPTILALMDTGVDIDHPTLNPYIWLETAEDENNCLPTDTIGWNFVSNNNNSRDNHDHGTHLAGIIVQEMLTAPTPETNFRVLPIKTHDKHGFADLFDVSCGLYYALQQGANVVNCSWGWLGDSSTVWSNVLDTALLTNTMVIAAAGNDGIWLDTLRQYPAGYQRDNLLAVTSVNTAGTTLSSFSNFSNRFIQIAAPGEDILSTVRNNGEERKSGTSMSAPAVAAQAGRIYQQSVETPTIQSVRDCILASADLRENLGGVINAGRVLSAGLGVCSLVSTAAPQRNAWDLLLSPNPAFGSTQLLLPPRQAEALTLSIIAANGQTVRQHQLPWPENGRVSLNLSGIPPGIYFVRATTPTMKGISKLVISSSRQ